MRVMKCELCGLEAKDFTKPPVIVVRNGQAHTYCCVTHAQLSEPPLTRAVLDESEAGKIIATQYPQQTVTPGEVAAGMTESGLEIDPSQTTKLAMVDQLSNGAKEDLNGITAGRNALARDILFWQEALATYDRSIARTNQSLEDIESLRARVLSGEL